MERARRALLGCVVLATALVGAACGGDDSSSSGSTTALGPTGSSAAGATTTAAAPDVDPDGVLRVVATFDFSLEPSIFDPTLVKTSVPFDVSRLVYDTLLRQAPDGSLEPGLAKRAEIVSPTQIDIELNPGITFTDGASLDAAALKANYDRDLAKGGPGGFRSEFFQISQVEVTGPLTASLVFKTPVAGTFYNRLALHESILVSPKAIEAGTDLRYAAVGAGPFTVKDFPADHRSLRLEKNPGYFQADRIKLAEIDFTVPTAPEATVNALLADQVDLVQPTFTALAQLKANPSLHVDVRVSPDNGDNIVYCKNRPPFDDVKVRQALNYAVDRDAINQALYGGQGEPAWSLFPKSSPLYDPTMDHYYAHDVAKAKALLAEAGHPDGLAFDLTITSAQQRLGEVIQGQVAEAGFQVALKPTQDVVADFYQGVKTPAAVSTYTGAFAIPRNYQPGPVGNVCGYDNPQVNSLLAQIAAVDRNSEQSKALWHQMEELFTKQEAAAVHLVFRPQLNAWNTRVGGEEFLIDILGRPAVDLTKLYIKA
jgi:peptide/nickel transport system substrate-binding protein